MLTFLLLIGNNSSAIQYCRKSVPWNSEEGSDGLPESGVDTDSRRCPWIREKWFLWSNTQRYTTLFGAVNRRWDSISPITYRYNENNYNISIYTRDQYISHRYIYQIYCSLLYSKSFNPPIDYRYLHSWSGGEFQLAIVFQGSSTK